MPETHTLRLPRHLSGLRLSLLALVIGSLLFVASPASGADTRNEPRLEVRRFCQIVVQPDNGSMSYEFNFAAMAENLEPKEIARITYRVPVIGDIDWYEDLTSPTGEFELTTGTSLALDDTLLLGEQIIFTVTQGDTSVTQTSSYECDPEENAPASRAECRSEVLLFFFRHYGFDFPTAGDCVAFVSRQFL